MPPLPPNLFKDEGIGIKTDFRAYDNLDDEYLLEFDRLREDNDRRGYPMSAFEKEYLARMLYEQMYMYKLTDEQRAQFHGMTLTEYKNAANNYVIRPDESRWWYEMPDEYKRVVNPAQTAGTGGSGTGGGSGTEAFPGDDDDVTKEKTSYLMYISIAALLIIIGLIIYFLFNKKLPKVVKTAFGLI